MKSASEKTPVCIVKDAGRGFAKEMAEVVNEKRNTFANDKIRKNTVMKRLWKKFDELTGRCCMNMIGAGESFEVWNETFAVLLDIISLGREKNPNYAKELADLDDDTDFEHDISGWLEDYLDELDMKEKYETLLNVCDKLLELFCWEEDSPSDIRFRKASALGAQGKKQEALEFSEAWYRAESDNMTAVTSLIYSRIGVNDLAGAEKLVEKYISDDSICDEDNDIVFTAASLLYKTKGDKKKEKRINKAIQKYEEELEEYFLGMEDYGEEDFDFSDDELPFS